MSTARTVKSGDIYTAEIRGWIKWREVVSADDRTVEYVTDAGWDAEKDWPKGEARRCSLNAFRSWVKTHGAKLEALEP